VRIAAAIGGITAVLTYTIAHMVGSGFLVRLLLGIPYELAEVIVGAVMLAYVLFGGVLATTWLPIIKAGLLLGGVSVLLVLALGQFNFTPRRSTVWVDALHNAKRIIGLRNPCLISMPAAFVVGYVVSLMTPKVAQEKVEDEKLRTYLGVGAE